MKFETNQLDRDDLLQPVIDSTRRCVIEQAARKVLANEQTVDRVISSYLYDIVIRTERFAANLIRPKAQGSNVPIGHDD